MPRYTGTPIGDEIAIAATEGDPRYDGLDKFGREILTHLTRLIVSVTQQPHVVSELVAAVKADIGDREVVYMADPSRIRATAHLVRTRRNRWWMAVGAALGLLVGLVVLHFLSPGTINVAGTTTTQFTLSNAVNEWWYQAIVLVISTGIGAGIAALFNQKTELVQRVYVVNDDGTEYLRSSDRTSVVSSSTRVEA